MAEEREREGSAVVDALAQDVQEAHTRDRPRLLDTLSLVSSRLSAPTLASAAARTAESITLAAVDRWDIIGAMAPSLAVCERTGSLPERTRLELVRSALEAVRCHPQQQSSSSAHSHTLNVTASTTGAPASAAGFGTATPSATACSMYTSPWLCHTDPLDGARRTLGALARPGEVADRLEAELTELVHSDTVARRHSLLSLLAGLSRIEPQLGSETLARGSARLIQAAQPLRWKLNRNKGEVREGLCRFLARALTKLCGELADEGKCGKQAASEWEHALSEAEEALSPWLQKKERKHGPYGLQLLTVIRCLIRNGSASLLKLVDEVIPRGLKDRNVRHAAVEALVHAARACSTRRDLRAEVWPRLQTHVRTAAMSLRRSGVFAGASTDQLRDSACSLAVACADVDPSFAVEVPVLLASEPSSCIEAASAGLAALLAIAQWDANTVHQTPYDSYLPCNVSAIKHRHTSFESAAVPSQRALDRLFESIRIGENPLPKVFPEPARKRASSVVSSVARSLGLTSLGQFYQNFHAHHLYLLRQSSGRSCDDNILVDEIMRSTRKSRNGNSHPDPVDATTSATAAPSFATSGGTGNSDKYAASALQVSVSPGTTSAPAPPLTPPSFQTHDSASREKIIALPWFLKLAPVILPDEWLDESGRRLGGALSQLAMPEDSASKGEAGRALLRCIRCMKQHRAGIVESVSEHTLRLPDQALEQAAKRLAQCTCTWRRCIELELDEQHQPADGDAHEGLSGGAATPRFEQQYNSTVAYTSVFGYTPSLAKQRRISAESLGSTTSTASPHAITMLLKDTGPSLMTLAALEGSGLALLAQADPKARSAALRVLEEARQLGATCGRDEGEHGADVAVKSVVELEGVQDTQRRWMRVLASIARTCAYVAPKAAGEARRHALRRLYELAGSQDNILRESEVEHSYQWGLLACLASTADPRTHDAALNEQKKLFSLLLTALRVGPEAQSDEAMRVLCECPAEHMTKCFESFAAMLIDNEGVSSTARLVKPAYRKRDELRPLVATCTEELVHRCGLGKEPALAWRPLMRLADDFASDNGKVACRRALCAIASQILPEQVAEVPAAASDHHSLRTRKRIKNALYKVSSMHLSLGPALCGPAWDESEACMWAERMCDSIASSHDNVIGSTNNEEAISGQSACDPTHDVRAVGLAVSSLLCALATNRNAHAICLAQSYKCSSERSSDAFFAAFAEWYLREKHSNKASWPRPHSVIAASLLRLTTGTTRREDALTVLRDAVRVNWNSNAKVSAGQSTESFNLTTESAANSPGAETSRRPYGGLRVRIPGDAVSERSQQRRNGSDDVSWRSFGVEEMIASRELATLFPERAEEMVQEIIAMLHECGSESKRRRALRAAVPWLEGASVQSAPSLVKMMFDTTKELEGRLPAEEEAVWQTLSQSPENVAPCIDYLVNEALTAASTGMDELSKHLRTARRVTMHVANTAPIRTSEHLAHHSSWRISEREFAQVKQWPTQADVALHLASSAAHQLQNDSLPALLHAAAVTALRSSEHVGGYEDDDHATDENEDAITRSDSGRSQDSDSRRQWRAGASCSLGTADERVAVDAARRMKWYRNDSIRLLNFVLSRVSRAASLESRSELANYFGTRSEQNEMLPKPEALIAAAAAVVHTNEAKSVFVRWAEECVAYAHHACSEAACVRSLRLLPLLRPAASAGTVTSLFNVCAGAVESVYHFGETSGAHRCASLALDAIASMLATPSEQQHAAVLPRAFWGACATLGAAQSLQLHEAASSAMQILREICNHLLTAGDAQAKALLAAKPCALNHAEAPVCLAMKALTTQATEEQAISLLAYAANLSEHENTKLFAASHPSLPCIALLPSAASRAESGWGDASGITRAIDSSLALHLPRVARKASVQQKILYTSSVKAGVKHVSALIAAEWHRQKDQAALLDALCLLTTFVEACNDYSNVFTLSTLAGFLQGLQVTSAGLKACTGSIPVMGYEVRDSYKSKLTGASLPWSWQNRLARAVAPSAWNADCPLAMNILEYLQTAELLQPKHRGGDQDNCNAGTCPHLLLPCRDEQTDICARVTELLEVVKEDVDEAHDDMPQIECDKKEDESWQAMTPLTPVHNVHEASEDEILAMEDHIKDNDSFKRQSSDNIVEEAQQEHTGHLQQQAQQQNVPAFLRWEEKPCRWSIGHVSR